MQRSGAHRAEAAQMAIIHGDPGAAANAVQTGDSEWLVGDTASDRFAEKVSAEALADPATMVVRDDAGS